MISCRRRRFASTGAWFARCSSPTSAKLSLCKATTQRLDAYYASLVRERELSPASIRHVHAMLRARWARA